MKVAILDDLFGTLRTLPCFERLAELEVTIFTDHAQDTDILSERLRGFDALVLIPVCRSHSSWPRAASPRRSRGG